MFGFHLKGVEPCVQEYSCIRGGGNFCCPRKYKMCVLLLKYCCMVSCLSDKKLCSEGCYISLRSESFRSFTVVELRRSGLFQSSAGPQPQLSLILYFVQFARIFIYSCQKGFGVGQGGCLQVAPTLTFPNWQVCHTCTTIWDSVNEPAQ